MKIRVSALPPEGKSISDHIPLTPLNKRMDEGSANDIQFLDPPLVEILLNPGTSGSVSVTGSARARFRQPCARCLEELEETLKVPLSFVIKPVSERMQKSSPEDLDDVGILYYEGDEVDLEDTIQEALILALSPFHKPELDEHDRCTLCGLDFSEKYGCVERPGVSLGTLLQEQARKKRS